MSTIFCLLSCAAAEDEGHAAAFYLSVVLFISVQTALHPKSRAVCQGRSGAPPPSALCGLPESQKQEFEALSACSGAAVGSWSQGLPLHSP